MVVAGPSLGAAQDESTAETLIGGSWEARDGCLAAVSDAAPGKLPPTAVGLSITLKSAEGDSAKGASPRGLLVTAFGPNPYGEGTLLRLWDQAGSAGTCTIGIPAGIKARTAQPCDLRGQDVGSPIWCYRLDEVFVRPEDFFKESISRMAGERLDERQCRPRNPACIGHSITGTLDQGMTAEGIWTTFRELKPGATDAIFDVWAPVRWCLFAEPLNVYRQTPVKLEAVLVNEDALPPGEYPVRLQVVGPNLARVFEKTITVKVADPQSRPEPPMVHLAFTEDVVIDGPPGRYRFLATFEERAVACGEEIQFFVDVTPEEMPKVEPEVLLMSDDKDLAAWLTNHGIRNRPYTLGQQTRREVILCSGRPTVEAAEMFKDLAQRIARGSTVVFLTTDTYARGNESCGWLPLKTKGSVSGIARWLYHSDEWCKRHPIFEGLPAGGVMDYGYYREIIPDVAFMGIEPAAEPVAGGINASWGYQSGLMVAVYALGDGEFILNSLRIRDNLGIVPQADRLLRNMLRFAGRDASKPLTELPADFDAQLRAIGYP